MASIVLVVVLDPFRRRCLAVANGSGLQVPGSGAFGIRPVNPEPKTWNL